MVAFTGERIGAHDEDFGPDWSQHMAAYRACLPFVSGKVVLDGGCGEGYGAKWIAESARMVVGVDRSWETAREALCFGPRNLHLSCSDLRRLGLRDGSFDVVCSFQVLEHFREPLLLLQEAARVLRPEGVLVLSTPNRIASFSENPYHLKEYRPEELRELLEAVFRSVAILGIFGSERVRALQCSRRRQVTRILRLDPFGLRRVLPEPIQKWAFARLARFVRRRMRADHRESFGELGPSDFTVGESDLKESMDLLAVCRK